MSKYLQIKMLKALQGAESSDDVRGDVVSEGMDSLKKNISDYKTDGGYKPFLSKVEHTPNYEGTELAEVAVDVYKKNIKPQPEEKPEQAYRTDPVPMAAGQRYHYQAMARALAGMRNGGDGGRLRQDAGPNGGDMRIGDGRVIHTEEKTVADMTIQEYQEYLTNKNLQIVEEVEQQEPEQELLVEDPVKDLEQALLEMKEHSWQSIDKVMRGIAKEYDMTPKQLHKDFKSAHGGQIPDDWAKEQAVTEECGWFPMSEATLMKQGAAYDVNMIYKGQTTRLKFFWPDLSFPSRDQMQEAASRFYPGSRLIAYYPTLEEDDKFMVLVPPLTENFSYVPRDAWTALSDEANDILNEVEETEGEIVSGVEMDDEGKMTFFISDNETGEERQVIVEGEAWTKSEGQNKSGGLNEKGRKSYEKANPGSDLKAPTKDKGNPRRKSFCARMKGMRKRQKKSNNTGEDRLSKSLKAWDC